MLLLGRLRFRSYNYNDDFIQFISTKKNQWQRIYAPSSRTHQAHQCLSPSVLVQLRGILHWPRLARRFQNNTQKKVESIVKKDENATKLFIEMRPVSDRTRWRRWWRQHCGGTSKLEDSAAPNQAVRKRKCFHNFTEGRTLLRRQILVWKWKPDSKELFYYGRAWVIVGSR